MKTRALMVFKLDEEGNALYTQDIGDLCIFLSKSEPFCVPASSFPGLYGFVFLSSSSIRAHAMIMNSEATVAEAKLNIENLNLQLGKVRLEFISKEDEAKCLVGIKEKLEQEKPNIQLSADNLSEKLISSDQEVKKLEGFVHSLATELAELDKKNLAFMEKFDELNGLYGTHLMLLQKDRDIASDHAQRLFDQLQGEFLTVTFQKEALQSAGNELYEQKDELQKAKASLLSQLAEERCSARYRGQGATGSCEASNAETELKERITTLRDEHDVQLKAFKCSFRP